MTVTAQAGVNGNVLERALNERGLMLPHYPASSEWATVGGYVAARGSGVLSTRYGKIEDLVLALRVALAERRADRHRPASRATPSARTSRSSSSARRARSGSSPARRSRSSRCRPSAASSPCTSRTSRPASSAFRTALAARQPAVRHPHVRRGGDARARSRPSSASRWTACAPSSCFEGETAGSWPPRAPAPSSSRARRARASSIRRSPRRWWDRRYDFYKPPHHPELPSIWGTIDVVASYTRHRTPSIRRCKTAVRDRYAPEGLQLRMHFSHWYRWGTMIYARFLIPDGGADPLALHDRIWARRRHRRPGGRRRHERPPRRRPQARAVHGRATRTWRSRPCAR